MSDDDEFIHFLAADSSHALGTCMDCKQPVEGQVAVGFMLLDGEPGLLVMIVQDEEVHDIARFKMNAIPGVTATKLEDK